MVVPLGMKHASSTMLDVGGCRQSQRQPAHCFTLWQFIKVICIPPFQWCMLYLPSPGSQTFVYEHVRTLSMVSIYVSIQYYICFKHRWQPLGRRRVRCFPGIHHHVSFVRSKMEPLGFIIIIRPSCFEVKCCPWARSAGDMPYLCAFVI